MQVRIEYMNLKTVHISNLTKFFWKREDKKEAYWLGSSYRNHEVLGINKVNEPIKILGIFFTYDMTSIKVKSSTLKKSLSCWQWSNLTLIGKIQLVKTIAMPKFMH